MIRERVAVEASAPPSRSFAELVDELVATARTTTDLVGEERIDEARRSDDAARNQFAALLEAFPDAGEQALAMLGTIPPDSETRLDIARRTVLKLVLATTLADLHRIAKTAADRSRIDPLVSSLLTVMHLGGATATLGNDVLGDKPYLRLCHEPGVLEIVELAGRGEFPRSIATSLLMTLWQNLAAAGERSSADLDSMAMILMADADASKRTAACRHLLLDPRYRAVVLTWLRERKDLAVAADVTGIAARELPPPAALQVLRELAPVLPRMPSAYMVLATRSEELVLEEYYGLLASDTYAAVRSDLISGLGMARGAEARNAVELALQDPASQVRTQAMLTISAIAPERAEEACNLLLDDPRTANDPDTLAVVVMALDNLASAGEVNAVDRLGQRLRQSPLPEHTRQRLESILDRSLPGGRTSR
ncbi:MAG: hypothetical protein KDC98_03575 [Planctomycetes bacterium]|nr:hypothetical protein [Planctomycetota bacterium]